IVDSIIALFRVDFTRRWELADRQQKLAQTLSRIIKIAEEFNVSVYMTNQVIYDPGGGINVHIRSKEASRWSCSCSRSHDQSQFQEGQRRATSLQSLCRS
ncbi:hypothetical protein HID58_018906, partial [Brassica napus]